MRLASRARQLGAAALDLVYPPACAACDAALEESPAGGICADCRTALISMQPACLRCGAALPKGLDAGQPEGAGGACPRCRELRLQFSSAACLGPYDGLLRSAVLRIKRPADRILAAALGTLLAERQAQRLRAVGIDVVIPIPMHWTRRAWRGVSSPETIAGNLAARLGVPLAPQLLRRRRRTAPQASLSPRRRKLNVRGAFHVRPHRDLPGARVLLVDDILTTGATLNEAARTLRRAGSGEVHVAVLARAEGLV